MEVKTKYNPGDKVKIYIMGRPKCTHIKGIMIGEGGKVAYAIYVHGSLFHLPEEWIHPIDEPQIDESSRKGQAQIAAVENADKRLKNTDKLGFAIAARADYDNGLTIGFKDGVEWADKTMINAACEWLLHNAHLYVGEFTGDIDEEHLLKEFRKAMEE